MNQNEVRQNYYIKKHEGALLLKLLLKTIDDIGSLLISLLECTSGGSGRILGELGIIDDTDEEIDSIGADRLLGENLADIIAHQFGCRHLEFIAEISPESEEEFVVETVMVVKTHSGIGLTETAASHLIGAAAIERHHISMERNIAMIEEERRQEDHHREYKP